ncbi:MAG: nitrile hydratase subunit beta [Hyphomicrobiales bacterium]
MNSAHDLGGMQGFGPVVPEPVKPVFHEEWEGKVLALVLSMAVAVKWNLDKSRHARESLPPPQYLTSSYYQIWWAALEKLMVREKLVTAEELETGKMVTPPLPIAGALKAEDVPRVLRNGGPCDRPIDEPAVFSVGDQVSVRNFHPMGHTRAPRYLRGHQGEIIAAHGGFVFPDSNAEDAGENPKWLYTVRFSAQELWGDEARAGDRIMADLWEPYLEKK